MSTATSALPKIDGIAPPAMPLGRLIYWLVSRELWENRYLYIAPLAVSALIIVGFALGLVNLPETIHAAGALDPMKQHDALEQPYTIAALLLMFVMFLSAMFYCLEALYAERRDRSVLFWKSLPVSDTMVVLAKASIPFVVVPVLSFAFSLMTQ